MGQSSSPSSVALRSFRRRLSNSVGMSQSFEAPVSCELFMAVSKFDFTLTQRLGFCKSSRLYGCSSNPRRNKPEERTLKRAPDGCKILDATLVNRSAKAIYGSFTSLTATSHPKVVDVTAMPGLYIEWDWELKRTICNVTIRLTRSGPIIARQHRFGIKSSRAAW
jgi:hypothetical protein